MLIKKIYVKSFGKLNNFTLNFDDGLNTIVQNNSFGKSTLATFIKAMFYGFDYKKKNGIDSDARMVAPWDSKDTFGGYLDFTHNGSNYRIERTFGTTARHELGRLINQDTGEIYSVDNVGKKLFGVDSVAFEQSLFIPQETVQITANADFISKLTNMVDGNKEQNNFDKAEKALIDLSKEYKHLKGNGGQIYATESQVYQLRTELEKAKQNGNNLQQSKQRFKQVNADLQRREQDIAAFDEQIEQVKQTMAAKVVPVDAGQLQQLNQARAYLTTHSPSIVDDYGKATNLHQQRQAFVAPKLSPLIWLALLVAVGGIVAILALQSVWYVGLVACVVGAFATILLATNFSKAKAQTVLKQSQVDKQLATLFATHKVDGTIEQKLQAMHELREKWLQQQTIYNTLRGIVGNQEDVTADKQQLDRLQSQKNYLVSDRNQLLHEKGSLETTISMLQQSKPEFEVDEELQNAIQRLDELKQKHQSVQITLDILRKSKEIVSSNYLPPLTNRVAKLLKGVVNIQDVLINKDFEVFLQENGSTHKVQYFSRGIQELTAFCFRIALSQSVYGELPLLVVDDAFVNLDEDNFAKAMQILKDLSQTTQVIYFSCHQRSKTN